MRFLNWRYKITWLVFHSWKLFAGFHKDHKILSRRVSLCALLLVFLLLPLLAVPRELTKEDLSALQKGEIVKDIFKEEGTQSGSWSVKIVDCKPELFWAAISAFEDFDELIERTTVSVLLDEKIKDKVVAAGDLNADEAELLFSGNKPGYKKTSPDGKWTVYSYQRNEFPWPVSDRWVLLEITHDEKAMIQTWKRLAGNMKEDYGSWKLKPTEDGKTFATNEIHIDLDIPATGPFTAFAMEVTLPDTYTGFEAIAEAINKKTEQGKDKDK
jgi:hypothetical protein